MAGTDSEEAQDALQMRDYAPPIFCRATWPETGIEAGKTDGGRPDHCGNCARSGSRAWRFFRGRFIQPQRHRGIFRRIRRGAVNGCSRGNRLFGRPMGYRAHVSANGERFPCAPPWGAGRRGRRRRGLRMCSVDENRLITPCDLVRALEQWDVMFFVQGIAEMILREARVGMKSAHDAVIARRR